MNPPPHTPTRSRPAGRLDLSRLNRHQREAVLHGDGPILILAGAGSGKTSTMAYRIAHLIAERGVSPQAILGVSFTRKAASELKDRVKKLVGQVSPEAAQSRFTITTFHSFCVQVLRAHADRLGYQRDFTILDSHDQLEILQTHLRNLNLDDRKFDPAAILFEIGQAKNRFLSPEQAENHFLEGAKLPSDYAIATASCYEKYQGSLRSLNAMDFDDLIFNAVRVMTENPDLAQGYSTRFRYLLVDEYQDTNPAQFKLLRLLTCAHQNICVVGDDDQSIYAWRGADPAHILGFGRQFEGARVITLDQNYRSTSTILDAANEVIAKNTQRHAKHLWSDRGEGEPILEFVAEEDRAEAELVAEEILKRAQKAVEGQITQLRPWKDFAVLYRSNPQSRLFEEALRMRQIPYKVVGTLSFLDRKEVKDVLSYWRLVVNPKDDASARRVANWPPRGIGRGSMEAYNQHKAAVGGSFFDALSESPRLTPKCAGAALALRDLILGLRRRLEETPLEPAAISAWARSSLDAIGAKKALEDECEDPAQSTRRFENMEELANALGQLSVKEVMAQEKENGGTHAVTAVTVLREFIVRMTLNAMDEEEERERNQELREARDPKDQVTLLTLHGAKGLEYPIVFLVGMEDGFLPHRRVIEEAQDLSEERRLCYVGITRARDHLIITRAKHRIRYGKAVPRLPSRFLADVPRSLIIKDDQSLKPEFDSVEQKSAHENRIKGFLDSIRSQVQTKDRR